MKAILITHIKQYFDEASFVEIKIWKIPVSDDKPHGFKYSLVYIENGKRIIGYDNSEQKGDHKHIKNHQYEYDFINENKLIDDFYNDVLEVRK
jgi:hypothetical protein